MRLGALLVLTLLAAAPADADDAIQFSSGERRVVLLELYTSEGCSSCPPADRWLSGLKSDPGLWSDVVPVAFHVDYWNYLGWRDRFADDRYSDRQRRYRHEEAAGAVYTPGFFAGGAEWLGWRSGGKPQTSAAVVGPLRATVRGNQVEVRFEPAAAGSGKLNAHVALLGMHRQTAVLRGENRGRRLTHDFVVLDHSSGAMRERAGGFDARLSIDRQDAADLAVAIWVESERRQAPLQATGGWLPPFRRALLPSVGKR